MDIWTPARVGALELPHRLAMAPMTRDRSTPEGVPTELNVEYYRQRASMALIVTEGTQPSADGQGYLLTPGIYTEAHTVGWRKITDAVHEAGGHIIVQLMHTGRISHPSNTQHGRQSVAPSAVRPQGAMFTASGLQEMPAPRELSVAEIGEVVRQFRQAASAAMAAGFDGVEIHGASGYLVHQFLSSNANRRTDEYGGTIANRIRFAVDVVSAVADEIGADRTGLRVSPGNPYNDMAEDDTHELYLALAAALSPANLAYLHLVHTGDEELLRELRQNWPTALLLNRGGATIDERIADLEAGLADVITVGAMALANPDLPERIRRGAPLNQPDPATFYGGDHRGYIDYPTLEPVLT
ncbi:alkene reductase [Kineosporia succinea]|uniref:N-ethylmaleimide reductase n=1 Tax=Kineosporia succinea TaxID=84632 RepID=A0ABT9PE03_9ACTN|nr:alkene reductase [Kineosporia succinea]MDP9830935.1 N-ethylmaleimide reductase [Kineosporia succinea]